MPSKQIEFASKTSESSTKIGLRKLTEETARTLPKQKR